MSKIVTILRGVLASTGLTSGRSLQSPRAGEILDFGESIWGPDDVVSKKLPIKPKEEILPEEDALYYDLQQVANAGIKWVGPEIEGYIDPSSEFKELYSLPQNRRPTDNEFIQVLLTLYNKAQNDLIAELLRITSTHRTISSWLRDVAKIVIDKENPTLYQKTPYDIENFNAEIAAYRKDIDEFRKVNVNSETEDAYWKEKWDYLIEAEKRFISTLPEANKISIFNLHTAIIFLENADRRKSFDKFVKASSEKTKSREDLSPKEIKDLKDFIAEILDTDWLDEGYRDDLPNQGKKDLTKLSREETLFELLNGLTQKDKEEINIYIRSITSQINDPPGDFRQLFRQKLIDLSREIETVALKDLAYAG